MTNLDKDNNARIVILGAAGFIGYHLAKYFLLNTNYKLFLIDNFVNGKFDNDFQELILNSRVDFVDLDLSNEASYIDIFTSHDIVFNCLALNGTQNFYSKPVKVIRNSALTAILAAEYSALAGVLKYVYFGSSESYAGGLDLNLIEIPTKENVPLVVSDVNNSRWSYAASKSVGEIATIANYQQFELNYLILRLHNIYGPRMGTKHVIPDLIYRFSSMDGGVYGLDETRAFMYVNDFVEIVYKLIFTKSAKHNCIYNVGSMNEISIRDLALVIKAQMNSHVSIYSMGNFNGSVKRRCPDTSKLRSQIDFQETSISEGISKTVNWYLENKVN